MKTQLRKYIFEHDLKIIDMAAVLGCDVTYLRRIVRGYKPGKRLARDIRSITDDSISFDDHVNYKQSTKKQKQN